MALFQLSDYQLISTWESVGVIKEVRFTTSRSGGKGGQNVNKVSTKVELYWIPSESALLEEEIKEIILRKLSSKLSLAGELRVVCEEDRSQLKNKEKAVAKFYALLCSCFKIAKKRKATKPTKSSVVKRLDNKTKQKNIKANRKKPDY